MFANKNNLIDVFVGIRQLKIPISALLMFCDILYRITRRARTRVYNWAKDARFLGTV